MESGAAEQLRAAGIKVTPARVRVLEVLAAAARPASHAELDACLGLDRVTLYRVLDSLVACGLAVRSLDDRGVFRFSAVEARRRHAEHAHFRCNDCGAVFCLDAPPPPPPKLPRGFRADVVEVDVRGTCVSCRREAGRR